MKKDPQFQAYKETYLFGKAATYSSSTFHAEQIQTSFIPEQLSVLDIIGPKNFFHFFPMILTVDKKKVLLDT